MNEARSSLAQVGSAAIQAFSFARTPSLISQAVKQSMRRSTSNMPYQSIHFMQSVPSIPSSSIRMCPASTSRNCLLRHDSRQFLLFTPVRILPLPHTIPMSKIFCHSHRSSRIHPQRQRHQSAPESYLSHHAKPEEHRPDDHVQNLQADENDHQ